MAEGAIFGFDLVPIQRKIGHSITAARAYQAALCITDGRTGRVYDFRKKRGVVRSGIAFPDTADVPFWRAQSESQIWTAVEQGEVRADAVPGRTIIVPLPSDPTISDNDCCNLLAEQAAWMSRVLGVPVGWSFHRAHRRRVIKDPISGLVLPGGDPRNRHGHFVVGARRIIGREFASKRTLPDGTRGLDDRKIGSTIILQMRQHWEDLNNDLFSRSGLPIRIDCRSLVARGAELPPQIKLSRADLERARRALEIGETDDLPAAVLTWIEQEEAKRACRQALDEARRAELAEDLGDAALVEPPVHQEVQAESLSSVPEAASGIEQNAVPEQLVVSTERVRDPDHQGENVDAQPPTSGLNVDKDQSPEDPPSRWAMGVARRSLQQGSTRAIPSATHSPYIPLTYAAKSKWSILNKHYGQELDRRVGQILHFVHRPEKDGDPLTLDLISRETLEDYGDEIIVYSSCDYSDASITAFVALVKAANWHGVELSGTALWIERASTALQAAGIPWSVEGQEAPKVIETRTGLPDRSAQEVPTDASQKPDWKDPLHSKSVPDGELEVLASKPDDTVGGDDPGSSCDLSIDTFRSEQPADAIGHDMPTLPLHAVVDERRSGPSGFDHEAEHCLEPGTAPATEATLIARPTAARDPWARPLLSDNPAHWPKPVVTYAARLKEWQRRKQVLARIEPVLIALYRARSSVEKRGHASAEIDGLDAVDECLTKMLARIDSEVVDTHKAAVTVAQHRRSLTASQPSSIDPPERDQSPSRPHERDFNR
ncbi:MobA/MobL family protein [Azospirillum brasilense]|uniref:MobA/MobL family protein n=1 Tax=Azospirillum brasilense TaxID=192 RepID=UPI001EDB0F40|nr:MobA/MobL family protein [Azospirillum brasilense]UKJ75960.1 MobA/MobL family protein [Azospirillum brasilense]